MGFAKAKFRITGNKKSLEGIALVNSRAWYSVIDQGLAEYLGVKYTGLVVLLTSFSGHKVKCNEAIVNSITIEEKTAPYELVAICKISNQVKELLKKHEVEERVIIGVHTLERLGYTIDVVTHKLVKSPGILMI